MDKNLISVNIVAYNAEETLQKTLESITAQQGVQIEIVFVNDCSTDTTLQIIEDFKTVYPAIPCTIVSNSMNLGITKSRNIGLTNSKGKYIAVIDSDDTWTKPTKLKQQLDFLIAHPDHALVGTQMNVVSTNHDILKTTHYATDDDQIRKSLLVQNQFCHSSILMEKPSIQYDESFYIWEDYCLLLQTGTTRKLANLEEIMVDYLYVPRKYSFNKKLILIKTEIEIIKKFKEKYPNFWKGYLKRIIKYVLTLLHIK